MNAGEGLAALTLVDTKVATAMPMPIASVANRFPSFCVCTINCLSGLSFPLTHWSPDLYMNRAFGVLT